jgi:guanylate cyclase
MFFLTKREAVTENKKCQNLLLNMLPTKWHAEKLMKGELVQEELGRVTFLYSDICGFTELSSKLPAEEVIKLLDKLYRAFDYHLEKYNLYKVETIGDAFIVLGGMETAGQKDDTEEEKREKDIDHTGKVALYALDMIDEIMNVSAEVGIDFTMRIGIHVGSAVGGVIGWRRPRYFVWGKDTIVANAMESKGSPMQIMVSDAAAIPLERQGFCLDTPREVVVNGEKVATKLIRTYGNRRIFQQAETLEEWRKQFTRMGTSINLEDVI